MVLGSFLSLDRKVACIVVDFDAACFLEADFSTGFVRIVTKRNMADSAEPSDREIGTQVHVSCFFPST